MGTGYQFGREPGLIERLSEAKAWKTMHLIRHAETTLNAEGMVDGRSASVLTMNGETQAKELAAALRQRHPSLFLSAATKIVSSPAPRATATTELVFGEASFESNAGFLEVDAGDLQGFSWRDAIEKKLISPNVDVFTHFPKGESYAGAQLRAIQALQSYLDAPQENVVIVTHGGIIALIVLATMSIEISKFPFTFIDNASLTTIEFYRDSLKIYSKIKTINSTF